MSVPIQEALARIAQMYKDCLGELGVTAYAVPYFNHFQETFPYITLRVSGATYSDDGSEDFDVDSYTITARLVMGHITENYDGITESNLYTWIPALKTYFHEREGLQHETNSTTYDETDWLNQLVRARMTDTTGYRVFQNAGISTLQVGSEFSHACQFNETITPEYA